jgi:hypothetical protein
LVSHHFLKHAEVCSRNNGIKNALPLKEFMTARFYDIVVFHYPMYCV